MLVRNAIEAVLRDILNGSGPEAAWVLNPGDAGLLRSLDRVSAEEASRVLPHGSSSTASHVDHIRYGLSLLNRASKGENPFADADWTVAWRTVRVSDAEWARLRAELGEEAAKWQQNFGSLIEAGERELTGIVASVAHLAYHMGAIRQMSPSARGPSADASA